MAPFGLAFSSALGDALGATTLLDAVPRGGGAAVHPFLYLEVKFETDWRDTFALFSRHPVHVLMPA